MRVTFVRYIEQPRILRSLLQLTRRPYRSSINGSSFPLQIPLLNHPPYHCCVVISVFLESYFQGGGQDDHVNAHLKPYTRCHLVASKAPTKPDPLIPR